MENKGDIWNIFYVRNEVKTGKCIKYTEYKLLKTIKKSGKVSRHEKIVMKFLRVLFVKKLVILPFLKGFYHFLLVFGNVF